MRLYPVYALVILLVGSLLYVAAFPPKMWYVLGYYLTADEVKLAEYLAEQGLPAADCHRLLHFELMAPSVSEKRLDCIVRYAELTKDLAICERLMPSMYGMSCLGAAQSDSNPRPCTLVNDRMVEWGSYVDGTRQKASIADCTSGSIVSETGALCCEISKVTNIQGYDDCSTVPANTTYADLCYEQLALKVGDESMCNDIEEQDVKTACILRTRYRAVLSNYPRPIPLSEVQ